MVYRDMPADERAELLGLLGIEAKVLALYDGLAPGDDVDVSDEWDDE